MNHPPSFFLAGRQGFTLIEVLIAIALGSLVVYTATAGFRVAAQSMTIVNRLSVENAIMRGGLQQAHERLDFWTDYDNPEVPAEQTLRGKDAKGGLPFTPMSDVFRYTFNGDPEAVTGWNPNEPWLVNESRYWWHGNVAEKYDSNLVLGRYGIFANTERNPHVQSPMPPEPLMINPRHPQRVAMTVPDYGTVTVPHSWLYNQIWGLHTALGYYGFVDYLPANTFFACYRERKDSVMPGENQFDTTNQGGMPRLLMQPDSRFDNGEGKQEYCKSLWRLTMVASYAVMSPTFVSTNPSRPGPNDSQAHQQKYVVGYWNNGTDFTNFINETDNTSNVIAMEGPATWPKATVSIAHFIKTARYVSLCKIRWTSPLTGETAQLAFAGFGTTLRGARQQRGESGGWAKWNGAGNPANDRTLDGAAP